MPDGSHRPYELNISLIEAFKGTSDGEDKYQLERFICAHAIMLALEGVPGIYIHSLFATRNDYAKLKASGNNRAINRHNWDHEHLTGELTDSNSLHHRAFEQLSTLIRIRKRQRAFHPNATQFTMHFSDALFAFWRQSQDRKQSIFCLYNVSNQVQILALQDVNLVELDDWHDLITGYQYKNPRETIHLEPYEFVWITNR